MSTANVAFNFLQNYPNTSTTGASVCGAVPQSNTSSLQTSFVGSTEITSPNANNYPLQTITPSINGGYISIIATSANSNLDTICINAIKIVETPPVPSFSLLPTTINIPCNSTVPQTLSFTQTNSITNNGTLKFNWNFGNNNGWTYNGAEVPATLSTTSTSLTLTPDGTKTPSNFSVDEVYNGAVVETFNVKVTSNNPSFSIAGSSTICGSESYYINNLLSGSTVNWSASPSDAVSINVSNNLATITKLGDKSITLTAQVITACGNSTLTKQITVGNPDISATSISGPENITINTAGNFYSIPAITGASDYTWSIYPATGATLTGMRKPSISLVVTKPGGYSLTCLVTTSCGTTGVAEFAIGAKSNLPVKGGASMVTISPNPSTSYLAISVIKETDKSISKESDIIKSFKIYDEAGRLVKSGNNINPLD